MLFYIQAVQKCSYARRAQPWGMRRTFRYAAVTHDKRNAADERFSTAFPTQPLAGDLTQP